MLTNVQLKLSAVEDLAAGYTWYEHEAKLGDDFLAALETCLESIARHPRANSVAVGNIRRALVKRFPYSVFYEVTADAIVVRAIFHNARNPARWKRRLREDK